MGRRIALLVDNPLRDLPGLVMVGLELARRGHTCFLVPMNLREFETWALAPDFVLLNHLRSVYDGYVQALAGAGIAYGILDTEGAVFSPTSTDDEMLQNPFDEYALSMTKDIALRQGASCLCAWTSGFAQHVADRGWYPEESLVVTGPPRVDLMAPVWREALLELAEDTRPFGDNIILVNGSFPLANPRYQTSAKEMEMMTESFSYSRDYVEAWLQAQQRGLDGLIEIANKLAGRFPDAMVICRPHPFEGNEYYETHLENRPNLRVVKEGTVDKWLLRSKALVHFCSSTALDAFMFDVPAFSAAWLPTHVPVPAAEAVTDCCPDMAALEKRVEDALQGSYTFPAAISERGKHEVESVFFRVDGQAHQRVADAILGSVEQWPPAVDIASCRANHRKGCLDPKLTRMKRAVAGLIAGKHQAESQLVTTRTAGWSESEKHFCAKDITQILHAACRFHPFGRPDAVSPIEAAPASLRDDYRISCQSGRTVTVCCGKP